MVSRLNFRNSIGRMIPVTIYKLKDFTRSSSFNYGISCCWNRKISLFVIIHIQMSCTATLIRRNTTCTHTYSLLQMRTGTQTKRCFLSTANKCSVLIIEHCSAVKPEITNRTRHPFIRVTSDLLSQSQVTLTLG